MTWTKVAVATTINVRDRTYFELAELRRLIVPEAAHWSVEYAIERETAPLPCGYLFPDRFLLIPRLIPA